MSATQHGRTNAHSRTNPARRGVALCVMAGAVVALGWAPGRAAGGPLALAGNISPAWAGEGSGQELPPAFAALRPLVGYAWEIEATWSNGNALKARNEYRVGLNGNFVTADTFVSDAGGPEYQRYHSVFARHPSRAGVLQIHGFTYDGSVDVADMEIIDDGGAFPLMRVSGERKLPDGSLVSLRQEIRMTSATAFTWKVWLVSPEGESQLMDGVYRRGRTLD